MSKCTEKLLQANAKFQALLKMARHYQEQLNTIDGGKRGFHDEFEKTVDDIYSIAIEVDRMEDVLHKLVYQWLLFEGTYDVGDGRKWWGSSADAYYLLAKNLQNEWQEAKKIIGLEKDNDT